MNKNDKNAKKEKRKTKNCNISLIIRKLNSEVQQGRVNFSDLYRWIHISLTNKLNAYHQTCFIRPLPSFFLRAGCISPLMLQSCCNLYWHNLNWNVATSAHFAESLQRWLVSHYASFFSVQHDEPRGNSLVLALVFSLH